MSQIFSPVPHDRYTRVSHTYWQTHVPRKCQIRVRGDFRPLVVVKGTSVCPVRPCRVDQSKAQSFQNTSVFSQLISSILRSLRGRLCSHIHRASGADQNLRASVFRCKRGSPIRCSRQSTVVFWLIYRIRRWKFVNASLSDVVFRYCQLTYSYTISIVRPYIWSVLLSTTVIQLFIKCSRSVFDFSHSYSNFREHCYGGHKCLQNDVLRCPQTSSTLCCTVSWTSARVRSNRQ